MELSFLGVWFLKYISFSRTIGIRLLIELCVPASHPLSTHTKDFLMPLKMFQMLSS